MMTLLWMTFIFLVGVLCYLSFLGGRAYEREYGTEEPEPQRFPWQAP